MVVVIDDGAGHDLRPLHHSAGRRAARAVSTQTAADMAWAEDGDGTRGEGKGRMRHIIIHGLCHAARVLACMH